MKRLGSATARLLHAADRLLSALLMAASVTLLAAGVVWYGSPGATGAEQAYADAVPLASAAPLADPGNFPSPTAAATGTGSPVPSATAGATAAISPGASPDATTSAPPSHPQPPASASPSPTDAPVSSAVATRIVIPSLEIDLPIVSRDLSVPNQGPGQYPPCDVAVYHTAFVQPGEPGTTYIYGHAREGMFLPLLTGAEHQNGADMIGSLVEVYTDDDLRYVYVISQVKRHAVDFSIADAPPGVSQLVLQTSEGPRGTVPKLQVLAELQDVLPADHGAAHPKARPRACYDTP